MSLHFFCKNEDNEKEESINNYKDLFKDYVNNPPTLNEALNQIFISGGVPENEVKEYIDDLTKRITKFIEEKKYLIKEKYPNISDNDSYIICSYTSEAKSNEFSPYKILNRNLANDNRKEGIANISKYLYILLMALRKLPKYYPKEEDKYLYRAIGVKVNLLIDPYRPKSVPYIRNKYKTFWAFSSTSPLATSTYEFLGNKKHSNSKCGTIFSICGKVWGYDITVFNMFKEVEILLEPERKFFIDNVVPDIPNVNDIVNVTCEIIDTPIVLNDLDKKNDKIEYTFYNQTQMCCWKFQQEEKEDKDNVLNILKKVLSIFEMYTLRCGNHNELKFKHFFSSDEYRKFSKSELIIPLVDNIKIFNTYFREYIKKYGEINFIPKDEYLNYLLYLRKYGDERNIKILFDKLLFILQKKYIKNDEIDRDIDIQEIIKTNKINEKIRDLYIPDNEISSKKKGQNFHKMYNSLEDDFK